MRMPACRPAQALITLAVFDQPAAVARNDRRGVQ